MVCFKIKIDQNGPFLVTITGPIFVLNMLSVINICSYKLYQYLILKNLNFCYWDKLKAFLEFLPNVYNL